MKKQFQSVALALVVSLLGGCSTVSWLPFVGDSASADAAANRKRMERLVADDFATILAQVHATSPKTGPLAMSMPESSFGNALLLALRSAGYSLEMTDDTASQGLVRYNIDSLENQFGTSLGYRVSAKDVTLSRDYKMRSTGIYPISFMRIEGAYSGDVSLNDERFMRQNGNEVIISGITSDDTLLTPVVANLDGQEPVDSDADDLDSPKLVSTDAGLIVDKDEVARLNMYQTRRSNYAEYLGGFQSIEKNVLVFPNDSLRVLPESRDVLTNMHQNFNEKTDVYSVIGCSHGNTELTNGNELLALGRSKRILEELISLGVPNEQVLDEGCWAGVHFDGKMPRRGVVVELKRRSPS